MKMNENLVACRSFGCYLQGYKNCLVYSCQAGQFAVGMTEMVMLVNSVHHGVCSVREDKLLGQ